MIMEWTVILGIYLVIFVGILAVIIVVFRLIGAWMFRITDIINLQKEILEELKKINSKE